MSEPLSILFLNSAKSWGGNERWMCSAANGLAERGWDVHVAIRTDIFDNKFHKNVKIYKLSFSSELSISTYKDLAAIIKEHEIDILLPTKRKEYFIAGIIAKFLSLPVVFRLGITRTISKHKFAERFVYKFLPSKILVNAKNIKDLLVSDRLSKDEKIIHIYNGYSFDDDFEPFYLDNTDKVFTFASAGRLAAQKGFDILLESINILKNENIDNFKILIAGDGSERDDYISYINNKDIKNVELIGEISNVRGFFACSDAVLIPSRNEGVPNTLFEAWSVKKAVIASDAAGIPEVIENKHNGLICKLNPQDLANSIKFALANQELINSWGLNGYNKLHRDFTIDKMLDRLEEELKKLV